VDILEGPGVDVVGSAGQLVEVFGENRFDVIVTTEMMEHVEDWQGAVSHMKRTLKPGGYLILTTRSQGVNYHGYPHDYWRYEQEDMRLIFDDMEIIDLVVDRVRPGVFIFCRKPEDFHERPLDQIALYSILTRRRTTAVRPLVKRLVVGWYGLKKGSYHSYIRGRMWLWARFPASLRGWLKRRVFTAPK
jgi:SAM-dependent methyltransferase